MQWSNLSSEEDFGAMRVANNLIGIHHQWMGTHAISFSDPSQKNRLQIILGRHSLLHCSFAWGSTILRLTG